MDDIVDRMIDSPFFRAMNWLLMRVSDLMDRPIILLVANLLPWMILLYTKATKNIFWPSFESFFFLMTTLTLVAAAITFPFPRGAPVFIIDTIIQPDVGFAKGIYPIEHMIISGLIVFYFSYACTYVVRHFLTFQNSVLPSLTAFFDHYLLRLTLIPFYIYIPEVYNLNVLQRVVPVLGLASVFFSKPSVRNVIYRVTPFLFSFVPPSMQLIHIIGYVVSFTMLFAFALFSKDPEPSSEAEPPKPAVASPKESNNAELTDRLHLKIETLKQRNAKSKKGGKH